MVAENGTKLIYKIGASAAGLFLIALCGFLFSQIIIQSTTISSLKTDIAVVKEQNQNLNIKIDTLQLEIKELKLIISEHNQKSGDRK